MSVEWLRRLGVRHLRTGVSWADWFRADSEKWFDRQMSAIDEFDVTMTLCFTPEHLGIERHYTSPPRKCAGLRGLRDLGGGALRTRQAAG